MIRSGVLLAGLLALVMTGCTPAPSPEDNGGPVVLVVSHSSQSSGPVPAYEGLYVTYGIELGHAHALTRQTLAELRWRQIRTDFPQGSEPRVFEGPALSEVLALSGIANTSVRLTSVDGYEAEIEADMIARYQPILAVRADGLPLATGGLGPVMLVWPRGNSGPLAEMTDDLWSWGVFAITVIPETTAS